MKCPDCKGRGSIQLLVSAVPCQRCGGSGEISSTGGEWSREWAYVSSETRFLLPRTITMERNDGVVEQVPIRPATPEDVHRALIEFRVRFSVGEVLAIGADNILHFCNGKLLARWMRDKAGVVHMLRPGECVLP